MSPRAEQSFIKNSFLFSVKPINLVEEKGCVVGFEPVAEFLPSARFKSGINLVHDTVLFTRLMIPGTHYITDIGGFKHGTILPGY